LTHDVFAIYIGGGYIFFLFFSPFFVFFSLVVDTFFGRIVFIFCTFFSLVVSFVFTLLPACLRLYFFLSLVILPGMFFLNGGVLFFFSWVLVGVVWACIFFLGVGVCLGSVPSFFLCFYFFCLICSEIVSHFKHADLCVFFGPYPVPCPGFEQFFWVEFSSIFYRLRVVFSVVPLLCCPVFGTLYGIVFSYFACSLTFCVLCGNFFLFQ